MRHDNFIKLIHAIDCKIISIFYYSVSNICDEPSNKTHAITCNLSDLIFITSYSILSAFCSRAKSSLRTSAREQDFYLLVITCPPLV